MNNKVFDIFKGITAIIALGLFLALSCFFLFDILNYGIREITPSFFLDLPSDAGRAGGIKPILVSTILILLIAILFSLPLALGTAIFLVEYLEKKSHLAEKIRMSLEVLSGVPSIVFGLIGYIFFGTILGFGYSIVTGGLTLGVMSLPLLTTSIEQSIRQVPNDYRVTSNALGISKLVMIQKVILPSAKAGIVSGIILSIGRSMAETAALLFTSGYVMKMPHSIWDPGRSLSVHIFDLSMNVPGGSKNAFSSALTLILLITVIQVSFSFLSKNLIPKRVS